MEIDGFAINNEVYSFSWWTQSKELEELKFPELILSLSHAQSLW